MRSKAAHLGVEPVCSNPDVCSGLSGSEVLSRLPDRRGFHIMEPPKILAKPSWHLTLPRHIIFSEGLRAYDEGGKLSVANLGLVGAHRAVRGAVCDAFAPVRLSPCPFINAASCSSRTFRLFNMICPSRPDPIHTAMLVTLLQWT